MSPKPAPYGLLAHFYDELQPEAVEMNRRARWNILRKVLPLPASLCDLGCGSGETALYYARKGCRTFAVDNAPVFCRLVRRKARVEKLPVRVVQADMRSFRLPEPVELVTCEFAALNHLPQQSALGPALRSVFRALRPGGWFLFDVNTRSSLVEQYASTHWIETPNFKVVFQGSCQAERRRATLDFHWFLPAGRGLWRYGKESVTNIWWSEAELRSALRDTGFRRIRVFDGVDVRPFHPQARRGYDRYFLAQKPS